MNSSNFNGTAINGGAYIWFNANFTASGIPSSGATVSLANSTISFTRGGTQYQLSVPNAQVVFSPSATCSSTTFNTMTNTWTTTVPVTGDDEIFLTGLAWPVPAGGLGGGINPVNWQGSFDTNGASGVSLQWKWGAAVYSVFTTDYNALAVKPAHQTACGQNNGDHAGTPEGINNSNRPWNGFVVGGARGGGGSNWTGSWSSTQSVSPVCKSSSPFRSSQAPASFAMPSPSNHGVVGFTGTSGGASGLLDILESVTTLHRSVPVIEIQRFELWADYGQTGNYPVMPAKSGFGNQSNLPASFMSAEDATRRSWI